MKIFISHSSKDAEIAKIFSYFLRGINIDVEVFCSSLSGSIMQGDDFVKCIEAGLEDSSVFIPLISKNYCNSRYCLIELGFAYSKRNSYNQKYHILPFCIPPITKSEALLGTPLSYLQTAALNNADDISNFLKSLLHYKLISESSIMNNDIIEFVNKLNSLIMKSSNILENAMLLSICSDADNANAIQHHGTDRGYLINYNLFANGKNRRPDFISLVLKFPKLFDFYDFLKTDMDIKFYCAINNITNSIKCIDIEFKYQVPPQLLKCFKIVLHEGINNIEIPIKEANIEGLKQISEICYVMWDQCMTNTEGMFTVENIQVR